MIKTYVKKWLVTLASLVATSSVYAVDKMTDEQINEAQDRLKTTFSEMSIQHFQPSIIPGLFEVFAGNNILYFHPESETIFFGQIFDKSGSSLTQLSRQKYALERMKTLPLDSGIVIGPSDGVEVIEIGQMDCGYCQAAHTWLDELQKTKPIKRVVYFLDVPETHYATARRKAEHIICSTDQAKAFNDIHNNLVTDFTSCPEANSVLAKHKSVTDAFGVSGTPTFVIDGQVLGGFSQTNKEKIVSFVNEQTAKTKP